MKTFQLKTFFFFFDSVHRKQKRKKEHRKHKNTKQKTKQEGLPRKCIRGCCSFLFPFSSRNGRKQIVSKAFSEKKLLPQNKLFEEKESVLFRVLFSSSFDRIQKIAVLSLRGLRKYPDQAVGLFVFETKTNKGREKQINKEKQKATAQNANTFF